MARLATGSVRFRSGRWYARVTIGKGDRPEIDLPTCRPDDEEKAQERAGVLADLARRMRAAKQGRELMLRILRDAAARDGRALEGVLDGAERICSGAARAPQLKRTTFKQLGEEWTSGKLAKRYPDHVKLKKSVADDIERMAKYVYPVIGEIAIEDITVDHAYAVLEALPKHLAPATRRHVAQLVHRVLRLAAAPCRIIPVSPLPPGYLPSVGPRKALTYLYPDEERRLLACTAVPLPERMLYGFLTREGSRRGEASSLAWAELDLERGAIRLDTNKTDDPRAWALDPGVARALRAWREMRGDPHDDEAVFVDGQGRGIADEDDRDVVDRFRANLVTAKIDRAELYEQNETRRRIRIHDLRATFITVALANGRSETWVADRTGHTSSTMINRYRRAARTVAELGLGALAPLDEAIPEIAAHIEAGKEKGKGASGSGSGGSGDDPSPPQSQAIAEAGLEPAHPCGQRILNPMEALSSAPKCQFCGVSEDGSAPLGPSSPYHPRFTALRETPRGSMIADMAGSMLAALEAGDVAAARVAHEAIGRLIETAGEGAGEVIDIRRARRGEEHGDG